MTKSLEQIQQENRKFILEAIHGCSYEEALKKELGVGCKVKIKRFMSAQNFNEEIFVIDNYCEFFTENLFRTIGSSHHNEITEIIGKPLTLSRVLLAFKKKLKLINYGDEIIFNIAGSQFCGLSVKDSCGIYNIFEESYAPTYTVYGICLWNLELETLEEQAEEVQTKINELFTN